MNLSDGRTWRRTDTETGTDGERRNAPRALPGDHELSRTCPRFPIAGQTQEVDSSGELCRNADTEERDRMNARAEVAVEKGPDQRAVRTEEVEPCMRRSRKSQVNRTFRPHRIGDANERAASGMGPPSFSNPEVPGVTGTQNPPSIW